MPDSPDLHSELPLADRTLSLPGWPLEHRADRFGITIRVAHEARRCNGRRRRIWCGAANNGGSRSGAGFACCLVSGPRRVAVDCRRRCPGRSSRRCSPPSPARFHSRWSMSAIATSRSSFSDRPRSTCSRPAVRLILIRARFRKMPAPALSSPSAKSCFGVVGGRAFIWNSGVRTPTMSGDCSILHALRGRRRRLEFV